jgi:subtilase-type serine protease
LLGGNGSVGATTVGYGSILAPGNSIGTMAVNGNLTLDPGALYEVEANAKAKATRSSSKEPSTLLAPPCMSWRLAAHKCLILGG